jgi:hypothetical protein
VITEGVPGDGDQIGRMGYVEQAVVVVLVTNDAIVLEHIVVDPDVDGIVKSQAITALTRA